MDPFPSTEYLGFEMAGHQRPSILGQGRHEWLAEGAEQEIRRVWARVLEGAK